KYGMPPDCFKTMQLEDPPRVVVDITPRFSVRESIPLTRAVTWNRIETLDPGGYLLWNELVFRPDAPGVRLDVGLAHDRLDSREPTSSMVARTGALAGINATFFSTRGGPLGLVVRQGKVLSPPVGRRPPRTALGLTRQGKIRFDRVACRDGKLVASGSEPWSDVVLALGGGPRLLRAGRVHLTTEAEALGPRGNDITRQAARTAVALDSQGRMLMVTASGYHDNHRQGLTLENLAAWLLSRGAVEGMNFDGGASVSMAIGGFLVSDGPGARNREKPVATALLLFDEGPRLYPAGLELRPQARQLPADGRSSVVIEALARTPEGQPVPDGTLVHFWAAGAPIEARAPTLKGVARATLKSVRRPGQVKIRARCGAARDTTWVTLQEGPPHRLICQVTRQRLKAPLPSPSPSPGASPGPLVQEVVVTALVEDALGNPVSGRSVTVRGPGIDQSATTGSDGQALVSLEVPPAGAKVQVQTEGLEPQTLEVPGTRP
ncbi:MAG TPA: phosphodiester glycosidase family protein, partial [Candidatus Nitrosotenuis sp.]|nr:phosphodiester glycosidase family protein [Candidatus Nitrosotenuis sp.]